MTLALGHSSAAMPLIVLANGEIGPVDGTRVADIITRMVLAGTAELSRDGSRLEVKHPDYRRRTRRVFEYNTDTSAWEQLGSNIDAEVGNQHFGTSVSLSKDGMKLAASATWSIRIQT